MTKPAVTEPPERQRKDANRHAWTVDGLPVVMARQRSQAPNAQQMSALAVAIVKSSVPRGE
jgi:pyruvoyl-dependent arginine decarboxylase (PvlArgDC)